MLDIRSALESGLAGFYEIERELGRGGMARVFLAHPEDDAWALLQSRSHTGTPTGVIWMLYRARFAEKRGEREIALDDYGFVARLWANADEPLHSYAREAREGLIRLTSERW